MFADLGTRRQNPQDPESDPSSRFYSNQRGVIRTNCIDCLDRTNVGQFCIGRMALDRQMDVLGLRIPSAQMGDVATTLREMWADHGDCIAQQYGGSGAMHKVGTSLQYASQHKFCLLHARPAGSMNSLLSPCMMSIRWMSLVMEKKMGSEN